MKRSRKIRQILMIIIILTSSVCVLEVVKIEFFSPIWLLLFALYNFLGNIFIDGLFSTKEK